MKNSLSAVAVVASMFFATSALAADGKWEISAAANIENTSSTVSGTGFSSTTDTTQTFVSADVGRYFSPKLVGRVSLSMFGSDDGTTSTLGTTVGAGVKYYFGEAAQSKWIPFVQGGVNIVMFDLGFATAYGAGLVGGGGVSHFLTEDVSLDLTGQIFYDSMTIDTTGSPTLENSGQRILFGITARY